MNKISVLKENIILGTWQETDHDKLKAAIFAAGDAGYKIIDTAWIYQNEHLVGKFVNEYNQNHKNKLLIQTKIWPKHYKNTREQFFKQLESMEKNKIHSVLMHRIPINMEDALDCWKELIKLRNEGFIEHIGVSNFDRDDIEYLKYFTNVSPEVNQIELSVTNFRQDRVSYCKNNNIVIQAYSPLGNMLSVINNDVVKEISDKKKCTPAQIGIAFLLNHDLSVIIKSSNIKRIAQNLSSKNINISNEENNLLTKENVYDIKVPERMISPQYMYKD